MKMRHPCRTLPLDEPRAMSVRPSLLLAALALAGCAPLASSPVEIPPTPTSATSELPLDIR